MFSEMGRIDATPCLCGKMKWEKSMADLRSLLGIFSAQSSCFQANLFCNISILMEFFKFFLPYSAFDITAIISYGNRIGLSEETEFRNIHSTQNAKT